MKERPYQLSEFVAARRRAVLPPWVSRPLKRSGGRASPIPAHVRETGVALSDDERTDITRRLGMTLGKFAWSIERVTVRARDVNGPRGGVDQECTVKVVLSGLPSVVVKRRHALLQAAIDEALRGRASREAEGRAAAEETAAWPFAASGSPHGAQRVGHRGSLAIAGFFLDDRRRGNVDL